jgi:hypothetical protein
MDLVGESRNCLKIQAEYTVSVRKPGENREKYGKKNSAEVLNCYLPNSLYIFAAIEF